MGQGESLTSACLHSKLEMLSMTWVQFVKLVCELNERCTKFVDSDGRYLIFAIRKRSAETFFWKMTVRICALKKSLYHLLKDTTNETYGEVFQRHIFGAHNNRFNTNACIICMERAPDVILSCVHSFCSMCIEQWKTMGKDWCPLCRQSLQFNGNDIWMVPDFSENGEIKNYLLSLTEFDSSCSD